MAVDPLNLGFSSIARQKHLSCLCTILWGLMSNLSVPPENISQGVFRTGVE